MEKKNLLPPLNTWKQKDGGETTDVTDSFIMTEDGYGCSFTVSHESSYIYYQFKNPTFKGHTLKMEVGSFSSTNNHDAGIRVQIYDETGENYTRIDKYQYEMVNLPYEYEVEVPGNCSELRIYIRPEYASAGIDPPSTISVSGLMLYDTYTESLTALNLHKILEENLPENVTPGTEHIYMVSNGVRAIMYVSTIEGKLVPVMGDAFNGDGTGQTKYHNAYTQEWIDERKAEIISLQKQGDCITFVVTTDIHVRIEDGNEGRYNQVRDLLMVTDQIPVDYICCCGDIMSYSQDWDGNVEPRIEAVKNIFNQAKCPWFATRGNHDYNSDDNGAGGSNVNIKEFDVNTCNDLLVTARDWHKSITSKLPHAPNIKIVFDEEHPTFGYYYVDDYQLKHRMIFTNSEETHETELGRPYIENGVPDCFVSGIETEHQVLWLVEKALDMTGKTDWVVSFYSHTVPYTDVDEEDKSEFHGYGWNNPDLRKILKAFQNGMSVKIKYGLVNVEAHEWKEIEIEKDFSSQGPIQVIGWFGGHIHDDCYKKVDGLNVYVSACTCASRRERWGADPNPVKLPPERNRTDKAMSLNVFVVNKTTRTVYAVKLGSKRDNTIKTSSDHTFTY